MCVRVHACMCGGGGEGVGVCVGMNMCGGEECLTCTYIKHTDPN